MGHKARVSLLGTFALLLLLPAGAQAQATISGINAGDGAMDPGDGICTLREAVQMANTDDIAVDDHCNIIGTLGGEDTILLDPGTLTLSTAPDGTPDDNLDGDLDVPSP